ncbi:hypothetical protein FAI40_04785 [Acetobacteraceae bacterium]|nr:hypothetical protein FAI40_04785 [Acetobacteraceae bacterium]
MRNYLLQRTSIVGLLLVTLSLMGMYFGFLDENSALFLLMLGAGGLIPEDSPFAHKLLEILAPLLVHQIRQKSSHKPTNFFNQNSSLAGPTVGKPTFYNFTIFRKNKENLMENNSLTTPTPNTIETQLEQILNNALGDKLSAVQKASLHTAGTVTSLIAGSLLEMASGKIDTQELLDGISQINAGILQQEEGLKAISLALKNKAAAS